MQQAALVIAQIANDKELQKEVQHLIDMKMYHDDYIKFKDLFHPEGNKKLKSKAVQATKFAQKFRQVIKSNNYKHLKSTEDFDLEKFLVENNLTLYIPYPLDSYPESQRTPTITWHPLDNDSVGSGYLLTTAKSTNNVAPVPVSTVNEAYAADNPLYIITPELEGGGSASGGNDGSTGKVINEVKIGYIYVKDFYNEPLFEGALELWFLRVGINEVINSDPNNLATLLARNKFPVKLERKYIRYAKNSWMKGWKEVNVIWDSNWKPEKKQQVLVIYEEDKNKETTWTGDVSYTDSITGLTLTQTLTEKIPARPADLITVMEWDRDWFFATNDKPGSGNYFGSEDMWQGFSIRAANPVFWLTTPHRKITY